MRVRQLAVVGIVAVALVSSSAILVTASPEPSPDPDVEAQLEQVEAQVDELGQRFATATETEQDLLLIEIGALQQTRSELCGQLSTDSEAKDLYC